VIAVPKSNRKTTRLDFLPCLRRPTIEARAVKVRGMKAKQNVVTLRRYQYVCSKDAMVHPMSSGVARALVNSVRMRRARSVDMMEKISFVNVGV
jgi:hypothetical protein